MHERELRRSDAGWGEPQHQPGHTTSAVFSVRFTRDEIAQVRQAASRAGERTSEFIRRAALSRARSGSGFTVALTPSTTPSV